MKDYYVYILTNKTNDVLYTGITNNLERRHAEHGKEHAKGFVKKYRVNKLVYYEIFPNPKDAIAREKQIKNWRREKKITLINVMNPDGFDLSADWHKPDPSTSLGMTAGEFGMTDAGGMTKVVNG